MRFRAAAIVALLLLSSVSRAGVAGQAPNASSAARGTAVLRDASVPFHVGETLTYDVSWSSFLVAGTAVATVKEKTSAQNGSAYSIVAEGRPLPMVARLYALYYRMDTLVDSATLLSRVSSVYSEEGNHRKTGTTQFDRRARRARYELKGDENRKNEISVPAQAQDGLSALYALRALPLKSGARLELPVANEGELFTVSIEAGGVDRIRVPFAQVDALNLKLTVVDANRQPVGNNMAVWISTDARRLPVKLQAELPVGDFVLALKDVK